MTIFTKDKKNSYRNYFFNHVQLLILETSFVRVCQAINLVVFECLKKNWVKTGSANST